MEQNYNDGGDDNLERKINKLLEEATYEMEHGFGFDDKFSYIFEKFSEVWDILDKEFETGKIDNNSGIVIQYKNTYNRVLENLGSFVQNDIAYPLENILDIIGNLEKLKSNNEKYGLKIKQDLVEKEVYYKGISFLLSELINDIDECFNKDKDIPHKLLDDKVLKAMEFASKIGLGGDEFKLIYEKELGKNGIWLGEGFMVVVRYTTDDPEYTTKRLDIKLEDDLEEIKEEKVTKKGKRKERHKDVVRDLLEELDEEENKLLKKTKKIKNGQNINKDKLKDNYNPIWNPRNKDELANYLDRREINNLNDLREITKNIDKVLAPYTELDHIQSNYYTEAIRNINLLAVKAISRKAIFADDRFSLDSALTHLIDLIRNEN